MASGPLITAVQLADELAGSGAPVVLDCRWDLAGGADRAGYEQGHLPGAVFVDLEDELAAAPSPEAGRHPLPSLHRLQAASRRWGIRT
ncbi:MAG TPA: hypothetical protein VG637_05055, partial [Actinomycetes bacterium]|nr:hypothetical protein [Actinomycetes bacterium]